METTETIPVKNHQELPRDLSIGIGCIGSGFIMADCHLVAYRAAGLNPVAIASRKHAGAQLAGRP